MVRSGDVSLFSSVPYLKSSQDKGDSHVRFIEKTIVSNPEMQQQMMRDEAELDELNEAKSQLSTTERERDSALNEVKEIKGQNNDAEVNNLKECLHNAEKELQVKDNLIESLKYEVDKLKKLESLLSKKEASLQNAKNEANKLKSSLAQTERLLSDSKKKADRLAVEMGRMKVSEAKLSKSLAAQTRQIEQSTILLEKSKDQITSLEEQIQDLLREIEIKDKDDREEMERLKNEILVHKENVDRANERYYKSGPPEIQTFLDEIHNLKDELKKAMEAEDASKRAMDDLAVALKEVATESNQVKEKLSLTEQHLQNVKEEATNLKMVLKSKEEIHETLVKELKKENDRLNNTINRLRLEAEDALLAFNDRDTQFIKCIKSIEEEKNSVHDECKRLVTSLKEAEETSEKSKEENKKLRDILKQALDEANVAKEAASLAREDNYYLKDSLTEKDKALVNLARETERLRINEAEANESIKELKRVIMSGSKKEVTKLEKENKEHSRELKKEREHSRELKKEREYSRELKKERDHSRELKRENHSRELKKENHSRELKRENHNRELKKVTKIVTPGENSEKEPRESRRLSSTFSFDLNQLWPSIPSMTCKSSKDFEEDFDEDDALGGSIFDLVESPMKELPNYHRRTASACSSEDSLMFDQFDEDTHFDDMEIDRTSHGKRKALLRRFGDLLRRKNSHSQPPKDLPQPPKEVAQPPKEIPA